MIDFIDTYEELYNFSKERVEKDLRLILEYFYSNFNKFDANNVDLKDEAMTYHERQQKLDYVDSQVDQEHIKAIEEIIRSLRKKPKKAKNGDGSTMDCSSEQVEVYMSPTEREVKAIIDGYGIKVNRHAMKEEASKGYNKCKDNTSAFLEYKKGMLFPKIEEEDPYERDMARKKHVRQATRLLA